MSWVESAGFADARVEALQVLVRLTRAKRRLTVSEWADAHRVLSEVGSAEPGPWRTSRTPYLREIMDQLSEHSPARKVVFMKSSQVGGTEVGVNWLGYIITHAKGPVAVVMPTEKSLQDWMGQKFDPMVQASPTVREALARRTNFSGENSATRKRFPGGILYAKWAGSTAELKSTSLRYAVVDEIDEYDWDTGQGDPLGLIEVRLTTFADRKLYVPSSPTLKGASRIEELYELGDRRRYRVPCPHCGTYQALVWENVRWQLNPNTPGRVSACWYVCEACGLEIRETQKERMLARGRWVAENPDGQYPSYHLNALYAPVGLGLSWAELAEEWLAAQGDPVRTMRFVNTRLGLPWADKVAVTSSHELARRAVEMEPRRPPAEVLAVTAGVDVQDAWLAVTLLGWGRPLEANGPARLWVVDYHEIRLPGADTTQQAVWDELLAYLTTPLTREDGARMLPEAVAIDSRGHRSAEVRAFVLRPDVRLPVFAVQGSTTRMQRPIAQGPSDVDRSRSGRALARGYGVWNVGTEYCKAFLYGRLAADAHKAPQERSVLFPRWLPLDYYDGLLSEVFDPVRNRYVRRPGARYARNEPLDTLVYAWAIGHHRQVMIGLRQTRQGLVNDPGYWDRRAQRLLVAASGVQDEPEQPVAREEQALLAHLQKQTDRPAATTEDAGRAATVEAPSDEAGLFEPIPFGG